MKKLTSILAALSLSLNILTFPVNAAELSLPATYQEVLDAFNSMYDTSYQFATEQQLEKVNSSADDAYAFFTAMSADEFWDYLYDLYQADVNMCKTSGNTSVPDLPEVYEDTINRFNAAYGTSYQFASEEQLLKMNSSADDAYAFFTAMSADEFWDYLYGLYQLDVSTSEADPAEVSDHSTKASVVRANLVHSVQKYYSSSNSNSYLALDAYYAPGNLNQYTSVQNFYSVIAEYPAYDVYAWSYSYLNSAQQVKITYRYDRYLSANITDAVAYTGTVTFTAGS